MALKILCRLILPIGLAFRKRIGDPKTLGIPFEGHQDAQGHVVGLMPEFCGDHRYWGPSSPVSAGNEGITFKIRAGNDIASNWSEYELAKGSIVVAKATINTNFEDAINFEAATNECAVMTLLESSAAPYTLKCLGACRGTYRNEEDIDDGNEERRVGIIVTAPFLEGSQSIGEVFALGNRNASVRAMTGSFYAAAYMLAVGVVNPDLQRNTLYDSTGASLLIDFGLAKVLVPDVNATAESMGLDRFGFVEGEASSTLPLVGGEELFDEVDNREEYEEFVARSMQSHVNAALYSAQELRVAEVQDLWAGAWRDASKHRRFATSSGMNEFWSKIKKEADEMFYGRLLYSLLNDSRRTAGFGVLDPSTYSEILLAMKLAPGSQDGGKTWHRHRAECMNVANLALELATELEKGPTELEMYSEIARLVKEK